MTTFQKEYEFKSKYLNILKKYYIGFQFVIFKIINLDDDLKTGFLIKDFGNTKYIAFNTKKREYGITIHFGKYDPSISCSC